MATNEYRTPIFSEETDVFIHYSILSDTDIEAFLQLNQDIQHINIDNRDAWLKQADKKYQMKDTCGNNKWGNVDEYLEWIQENHFDKDDPQFGRE